MRPADNLLGRGHVRLRLAGDEERSPLFRRAVPRRRHKEEPPDENRGRVRPCRRPQKKLLGQVADDKDPLHERREQQRKAIARTEHTFEKIAEEYLAREGKSLRTLGQRRRMLKPVYKRFGSTPIDDIRRSDIVSLLDTIEDDSVRGKAVNNIAL
jgi:hypothetical protein